MTAERLHERVSTYIQAVHQLQKACQQADNEYIRDSVIQRFEFCWELAWKMLKLRLQQLSVDVLNPRDIFKEALNKGLIQDGNAWSQIQKYRNQTSHTYDAILAQEVYEHIKKQGVILFLKLSDQAQEWAKET
jgi:nucleotidyltransferase substrate binding protein (TIGR01987 family)